jgi:hypothetical protein
MDNICVHYDLLIQLLAEGPCVYSISHYVAVHSAYNTIQATILKN